MEVDRSRWFAPRLFMGLVVVTLGVLALLDNLGIVEVDHPMRLWPLVFVAIGATASAIGRFVNDQLPLLGRIAGAVIIVFGLHTMGVLRIEWLYQEKRVQTRRKPAGFLGAMLVGIAFAFGWTPCIGPILSGILFLAGSTDTVAKGVRLLLVYSLGMGVPFFARALALNHFFAAHRLGKNQVGL